MKQRECWVRKKKYGVPRKQWIWCYERPFEENPVFRSQAVVEDTNVMEVYYRTKPGFDVDEKETRKSAGRLLKEHLGIKDYISNVDHNNGMTTVSFYCRVDRLPDPETMKGIPTLIDGSIVELAKNEEV